MANFRRARPRVRTRSRYSWKHNGPTYFMKTWPAWWDIVFHRRPPRRRGKALEIAVMKGRDPDGISWPLNKNKHLYYW